MPAVHCSWHNNHLLSRKKREQLIKNRINSATSARIDNVHGTISASAYMGCIGDGSPIFYMNGSFSTNRGPSYIIPFIIGVNLIA